MFVYLSIRSVDSPISFFTLEFVRRLIVVCFRLGCGLGLGWWCCSSLLLQHGNNDGLLPILLQYNCRE
jgi:hypothetical protein